MAPDINSIPSSPNQHRQLLSQQSSTASSRRSSHNMPPPVVPASFHSPTMSGRDQSGIPIRHPRPLTAAELHLEVEKEQEAVVNRLTRELSALRAQHSASVASNASHSSAASTALIDPADPNPNHQITGPTHPTPSRRHRSSSSVSGRSITTLSTSTSTASNTATPHIIPTAGQSQASVARAAAAGASTGTGNLSRQPSVSGQSAVDIDSSRVSHHGTVTPGRPSFSQSTSFTTSSTYANPGSPSPSLSSFAQPAMTSISGTLANSPTTNAWENAERARAELEIVKAENEGLRQRIKSLERALRQRRESGDAATTGQGQGNGSMRPVSRTRENSETRLGGRSGAGYGYGSEGRVGAWAAGTSVAGPRERSESQSTTASSRRGPVGEDRDEVIRVGESAGNAGLR